MLKVITMGDYGYIRVGLNFKITFFFPELNPCHISHLTNSSNIQRNFLEQLRSKEIPCYS